MAYERLVEVGSSSGLHARPAAEFVRAAAEYPHTITIGRPGGPPVNAGSILSVLGLHVGSGETVVLSADDPAATPAVDALADLLAQDLDAQ